MFCACVFMCVCDICMCFVLAGLCVWFLCGVLVSVCVMLLCACMSVCDILIYFVIVCMIFVCVWFACVCVYVWSLSVYVYIVHMILVCAYIWMAWAWCLYVYWANFMVELFISVSHGCQCLKFTPKLVNIFLLTCFNTSISSWLIWSTNQNNFVLAKFNALNN